MNTNQKPFDLAAHRTCNVLPESTPAGRAFALQEFIGKLRRENAEMTYDQAFATANAAPEMRSVIGAMKVPDRTPGAEAYRGTPERKAAGARFSGLVKQAQHQRGISFDEAWRAVQLEETGLYAEMGDPTAAQASVWR